MIRNILTAAAFGLCLAGSAFAADVPSDAPSDATPAAAATSEKGPTADRVKAAKALMDTGIASQFLDTTRIVDTVIEHVQSRDPEINPEALKTIRQILSEEFDANKQKLLEEFTVMYAAHFSVADLKNMAKFYRSETGQHMLTQTPELGAESAQLVMPVMARAMERMREKLMADMEAKQKAAEDTAKKTGDDKATEEKTDKTPGDDKK